MEELQNAKSQLQSARSLLEKNGTSRLSWEFYVIDAIDALVNHLVRKEKGKKRGETE